MDSTYRAFYSDLHTIHWWWRAREHAIERTILRHIFPRLKSRIPIDIFEIGAASGMNFHIFRSMGSISGIEIDNNWSFDSQAINNSIIYADFSTVCLLPETYDLVVALDVIEHIQNDSFVMKKVRTILKPGGIFLVNVPAWNQLWTQHDVVNCHYRRYSPSSLNSLALSCGYRILSMHSLFFWPALGKLLIKLVKRVLPSNEFLQKSQIKIPPYLINIFLTQLSKLENRILEHFPSGPGSSLIAVLIKEDAVLKT